MCEHCSPQGGYCCVCSGSADLAEPIRAAVASDRRVPAVECDGCGRRTTGFVSLPVGTYCHECLCGEG